MKRIIMFALLFTCMSGYSSAASVAKKPAAEAKPAIAENLRAEVKFKTGERESIFNIYILSGIESTYNVVFSPAVKGFGINLLPVLMPDGKVDYQFRIEMNTGDWKSSMQGEKRASLGTESTIVDTPTEKVTVKFFLDN